MIIVRYLTIDMKTDVNFNKIVCLWFLWNNWYYDNKRYIISVLSSQLTSPYFIKTSSGFDKGLERSRATELLKVIDKTVAYFHEGTHCMVIWNWVTMNFIEQHWRKITSLLMFSLGLGIKLTVKPLLTWIVSGGNFAK